MRATGIREIEPGARRARRRGVWLAALSGVLLSAGLRADTVVLTPVDAQAETQDGVNWTVAITSDSLNASRFTGLTLQRRGVMEFSLSGGVIPADATIESAVLSYRVSTFTGGSGGTPSRIEFHGYAGDGVLAAGDAVVPFNLIGQTGDITSLSAGDASLDAAYVQSRLGGHLGVMLYQQTLGRQGAIYSADWFITADRPRLTVTYSVPADSIVTIAPVDGSAERLMGGPWVLQPGNANLQVYRSPVFQRDRRSIMEFPLRIPHRSIITRARLITTIVGYNFPPAPTVEFRGYAGDGVIVGEDADRAFTVLGVSAPVSDLDVTLNTDLSVAAVQSLLGAGSHLGVYGYQPTAESSLTIAGTGYFVPSARPALELSFRPPACRADHGGSGGVTVQDIFEFLNDYFQARPAADFDLSGSVGVQDIFEYLQAYFAGCG